MYIIYEYVDERRELLPATSWITKRLECCLANCRQPRTSHLTIKFIVVSFDEYSYELIVNDLNNILLNGINQQLLSIRPAIKNLKCKYIL